MSCGVGPISFTVIPHVLYVEKARKPNTASWGHVVPIFLETGKPWKLLIEWKQRAHLFCAGARRQLDES